MEENKSIQELEEIRKSYSTISVRVVEGLNVRPKEILKRIELYYNSEYESGKKDSQGIDKPFYNVNKYRVNLAKTATDLDTKDIQLVSDKPEFQNITWIYQKEIYKWMKESEFGQFLNELGFNNPKYGSVFVKKIETEDDEMEFEVCNIHNIDFDPRSFSEYTPIFECHYMSQPELYEKKDAWRNVESAMEYAKKRGGKNGQLEYAKGDVEVREMTGRIDGSIVGKEGYPLMHIFYTCDNQGRGVILYDEELKESNYKMHVWEKSPNRTLGIGIVEDGFEAQRWINDLVQRQKAMSDMASKIVFKTDDQTLGNNVLTELENGDVIKVQDGKDFAQVNNVPSQLPMFDNGIQMWDKQFERVSSTYNAITGENMPSNTPYRSVAILNNAATSIFDYKLEELGLFIQEIFEDWVFPYIESRLSKEHILVEDFSKDELMMIDETYAIAEANDIAIKAMLEDRIFSQEQYDAVYQAALEEIQSGKTRRFLKIPKNFYKNIGAKATLVITNENKNKGVILESLNNLLIAVAQNPQILENPLSRPLFEKVVELSNVGISPSQLEQASKEIAALNAQAQMAQPMPQQ